MLVSCETQIKLVPWTADVRLSMLQMDILQYLHVQCGMGMWQERKKGGQHDKSVSVMTSCCSIQSALCSRGPLSRSLSVVHNEALCMIYGPLLYLHFNLHTGVIETGRNSSLVTTPAVTEAAPLPLTSSLGTVHLCVCLI